MNFIVLTEPPLEPGSKFVATWIHDGRLWAEEYEVSGDGIVRRYNREDDDWEAVAGRPVWRIDNLKTTVRYLVAEQEA